MPDLTSRLPAWMSAWMSVSTALFFLLTLTMTSGYSVGAVLLFIGGLLIWRQTCRRRSTGSTRHEPQSFSTGWSGEDRLLCWLLLAVFTANTLAVTWHGDDLKYLDQGTRYLLIIPIVYGLRQIHLYRGWIVTGLALGSVGAAAVAWWQVNLLDIQRATGYVTSAIPFSDISLTMAFWCLVAAAWLAIRSRPLMAFLCLLAGLAGCYAMIAAATRGSLIAIPIMIVLAMIALVRRVHLRPLLVGGALALAAITVALTLLPAGKLADGRYSAALIEWQKYTQQGEVANNTVGPRLEAWRAALISIPERPFLGWGHPEYEAHLDKLISAGEVDPFIATLANTHNNFLEVWLHQGSLGLLALVALLVASFWFFARRLRSPDLTVRALACCGASLPASFAAYGMTQVILGRNNGVTFFLVSLAVLWAMMREAEASAGGSS